MGERERLPPGQANVQLGCIWGISPHSTAGAAERLSVGRGDVRLCCQGRVHGRFEVAEAARMPLGWANVLFGRPARTAEPSAVGAAGRLPMGRATRPPRSSPVFSGQDGTVCPWHSRTCSAAACKGNLSVLQWARQNNCTWGYVNIVCFVAASGKSRPHGCPDYTSEFAARAGLLGDL